MTAETDLATKLQDPRRRIPAGRKGDLTHITTGRNLTGKLKTACGILLDHGEGLIVLQTPEAITCPDCQKLVGRFTRKRR